jgi:hypothetical protein
MFAFWLPNSIVNPISLASVSCRITTATLRDAAWVSNGELIEALGSGVTASPYDKYRDVEFHVVHSNLNDVERTDAEEFVHYEFKAHASYGFVTIVSIALSLLTGLKFSFGIPGTTICSGLVAAALAAPQWREHPSHVMPADLAEYADITP